MIIRHQTQQEMLDLSKLDFVNNDNSSRIFDNINTDISLGHNPSIFFLVKSQA